MWSASRKSCGGLVAMVDGGAEAVVVVVVVVVERRVYRMGVEGATGKREGARGIMGRRDQYAVTYSAGEMGQVKYTVDGGTHSRGRGCER